MELLLTVFKNDILGEPHAREDVKSEEHSLRKLEVITADMALHD